MKTITLYEYCKSTFDGWVSWWSAREPEQVLRNDFVEYTDMATFKMPERWTHVYIDGRRGNVLRASAEFATDDGVEGYLQCTKDGKPAVFYGFGSHEELIRID